MKFRPPTRRASHRAPSRPSSVLLPAAFLLIALAISPLAAWSALRFFFNLAPARLALLYASRTQRAQLDAALAAALDRSPQTREAHALLRASQEFTRTLQAAYGDSRGAYDAEHRIAQIVQPLRHTGFGPYQLLAARLLALQRSGQPLDTWWASILSAMPANDGPPPHHFQQVLIEAWADAYESLRVRPGAAAAAAAGIVGHPHGPLLERLTDRLLAIARQREDSGDTRAAQLCRTALARLLRAWVLDVGPAGPRLAAAELLVRVLQDWPDAPAGLQEDLRRWREAYHQAVMRRPRTVIGIRDEATLCPREHERLVAWTATVLWMSSAAAAAGLTGLVLGWFWLGRHRAAVPVRWAALRGSLGTFVILAAGLAWVVLAADSVREDLRSDASALRYWWRLPMVAVATALAVIVLPGGPGERQGRAARRARIGASAVTTWLFLALAVWLCTALATRHERAFERAVRSACADPVAAVSGRGVESLLEGLRRWHP